eukprot:s1661_g3.t1
MSSLVKAFRLIGFARRIGSRTFCAWQLQSLCNFPIFEACSMTPHDHAKENDDQSWICRSLLFLAFCNQEPKWPEYGATEDAGRAKHCAWQRADGVELDQAAEEKEEAK